MGFDARQKLLRNKVFFQLGCLFIAVILLVLLIADIRIYQKKNHMEVQLTSYESQIASIEKSNQDLKDQIANSDNKDYLEKVAYEQLNQQKPGEKEYIFVSPSADQQQPQSVKLNFWDRIKEFWNNLFRKK